MYVCVLEYRRTCLNMDLNSQVFNAAKDGNLSEIIRLLGTCSKQEINEVVDSKTNGATPLMIASRYGHLDIVKYLIENCETDVECGGSVVFDGETIEGAPPLWCAAAAGYFQVVQFLVLHGAKVNNTTITNSTPLRAACFDGHIKIVKYLIEEGADIEIANRHGHTCLMIACYKGHYEIVKYLIEKNADVNKSSNKGMTCLRVSSLYILRSNIEQNLWVGKSK